MVMIRVGRRRRRRRRRFASRLQRDVERSTAAVHSDDGRSLGPTVLPAASVSPRSTVSTAPVRVEKRKTSHHPHYPRHSCDHCHRFHCFHCYHRYHCHAALWCYVWCLLLSSFLLLLWYVWGGGVRVARGGRCEEWPRRPSDRS